MQCVLQHCPDWFWQRRRLSRWMRLQNYVRWSVPPRWEVTMVPWLRSLFIVSPQDVHAPISFYGHFSSSQQQRWCRFLKKTKNKKNEGDERGSIPKLSLLNSLPVVSCFADSTALGQLVLRHVPEAQFLESIGQEITYILPYSGATDGTFAVLFRELDRAMADLGLSSYGISDATLEEVGAAWYPLCGCTHTRTQLRQETHTLSRKISLLPVAFLLFASRGHCMSSLIDVFGLKFAFVLNFKPLVFVTLFQIHMYIY